MSILDQLAKSQNSKHFGVEEVLKHQSRPLPAIEPQDLTGKVIIVTGANVGKYPEACSLSSHPIALL